MDVVEKVVDAYVAALRPDLPVGAHDARVRHLLKANDGVEWRAAITAVMDALATPSEAMLEAGRAVVAASRLALSKTWAHEKGWTLGDHFSELGIETPWLTDEERAWKGYMPAEMVAELTMRAALAVARREMGV